MTTNYILDACMSLSDFKTKVKEGAYGELTTITEPQLYQNDEKKWRLKLTLKGGDNASKKINLLVAIDQDQTYINIKSFENSLSNTPYKQPTKLENMKMKLYEEFL